MSGVEEKKAIARPTSESEIEAAAQPIERLIRDELDRIESGRSEAARMRLEAPLSSPRLTVAALASFLRALTLASELNQRHLDFYHLMIAFAADEATRRPFEANARCDASAVLKFCLMAVGDLPRDLKKPSPAEMVITPDLGRWIDAAWQKARARSKHSENQWIEPEDFFTAAADLRPDGHLGVIRKALDCSPAKTLSEVALEVKTTLLDRIGFAERSIQISVNGSKDSVLNSIARSRRGIRAGFRFLNRKSVGRSASLNSRITFLDSSLDSKMEALDSRIGATEAVLRVLSAERLPRLFVGLSVIAAIALGTTAGLFFRP
jgi:hypothetical protein